MRHGANLLSSLEGMSRPAFRIAQELTKNSRSGLTVRFLSKKLELPEEEIEYLLDLNGRLMYLDLTKVKIVNEGYNAIKRISDGLENLGDIPALYRTIKSLDPIDFRVLEEKLALSAQVTKKQAAEELVERYYRQADAVVTYVATRDFSKTAQEIFDIVWESENGLLPIAKIRAAQGGDDFETEEALSELFKSFALFEMFRFDSENRLIRVAALLSEIRQYRENTGKRKKAKSKLKPVRGKAESPQSRGLSFSDNLCKIVAVIAARPVRLRGDGELFKEDLRHLEDICPESGEPSLSTLLWAGTGLGWLVQVEDTLAVGDLESLIEMDRVDRHRILCNWLLAQGDNASSFSRFNELLEDIKEECHYSIQDFIKYAVAAAEDTEQPELKANGAHWTYISPGATGQTESLMTRLIEESFFWLGLVDHCEKEGDTCFQLTQLGRALLSGEGMDTVRLLYPQRQGQFVVQPNFDIVVPTQDMDPLLTVPLDQFSERKSSGQATVYNVSKDTFTLAVQEGHDADAFVEFLLRHNRGGSLPKNVMMTLEDWRGGMKRIKLRTIHVIESDDSLVMADLMHRRKLRKYFTPIDPKMMVQYDEIAKDELVKLLEKDGFVVE